MTLSQRASHKPELLAPAGDQEALLAALARGADAVYFGLDAGFNARARAANFSAERLPEIVARIHRAKARAYLTLNTLIFESELDSVQRIIADAARAGVDALIVQDPAVALIAKAVCETLELHASTQMTICNASAARFAERLGISRVVVPRELSVSEIASFVADSPLEVEVFIHGALCISWSGQCLTSEAWSARSANRGQCAQSCRMPYELVLDGKAHPVGDLKYLLSPKDLAGVRAVSELTRLGVHGLKIEGRQKSAHYVATAVAGYRQLLDSSPQEAASAAEAAVSEMALAYTRGFGDGFLAGCDHQTLVEGRFPKHRGIFLGTVVSVRGNDVVVRLDAERKMWTGGRGLVSHPTEPLGTPTAALSGFGGASDAASGPKVPRPELRAGLGVVFDAGQPERKDEPGGPIFSVDVEGTLARLRFGRPGPDLSEVRAGQRVWITSDPVSAQKSRDLILGGEPEGRHPLRLKVRGALGSPLILEAQSGKVTTTSSSFSALVRAESKGLDHALLLEKLGAVGGSIFHLEDFDTSDCHADLYVSPRELKQMRRAALNHLTQQIERGQDRTVTMPTRLLSQLSEESKPQIIEPVPTLVPLCRTAEQLEAVLSAGVDDVELDWMELTGLERAVERVRAAKARVTLATLRVQKPGEERFESKLLKLKPDGLLIRHFGALMDFAEMPIEERPVLHGDFSLNVTNSITARHLLDLGLATITPSFDLDHAQLFGLLAQIPGAKITLPLHHHIATFHTEHCVYAHVLSAGRDYRSCGRPCEQHQLHLRDHQGRSHPVVVDAACRNTVFNAEPQSAGATVSEFRKRRVARYRVEFVRENGEEVRRLWAAYVALTRGERDALRRLEILGIQPKIGISDRPMSLMV